MEKGPEIAGRTVIRLLVSSKNIFHGNGNRRRFLAGCPNEGSCGGEGISSAIRLAYPWRTRHTFGPRPRRTAPNTHTDSGGPDQKGRAAVPGNLPRQVPIPMRSQHRRHSKKRLAHSPKGASRSNWNASDSTWERPCRRCLRSTPPSRLPHTPLRGGGTPVASFARRSRAGRGHFPSAATVAAIEGSWLNYFPREDKRMRRTTKDPLRSGHLLLAIRTRTNDNRRD
jgi:hypothetical protein